MVASIFKHSRSLIQRIWIFCLLLATAGACAEQAAEPDKKLEPSTGILCRGETESSWLKDWRERIEQYDAFFKYAAKSFGPMSTCEGARSSSFGERQFGRLKFEFQGKVWLEVETFPPESSRISLHGPDGFPSPDETMEALKDYVARRGAQLSWSEPVVSSDGDRRTELFGPADQGINAKAVAEYLGDRLIKVSFSLAL